MQFLPSRLAEICKTYPLREKALLAPTLAQGHQAILLLAGKGHPSINLRPATIETIALEVAGTHLERENLAPIPEAGMGFLMENLFLEVSSRKDSYFHGLQAGEGIVGALSSAILEMRLCGLGSKELGKARLVDPRKGQDLADILAGYEAYLSKERLYDYPGLLKAAIELMPASRLPADRLHILPSDMSLSPLEKAFIDALRGEKLVIPHRRPAGLATPTGYFYSAAPEISKKDAQGRLRWLFEPKGSPAPVNDGSISIFHGMGRRNEVREVFRRVVASGMKCDYVELVHTSYDTYVPLIRSVTEKLGVAVTFAEGLPMANTRPGRALEGFLSWIASGFEAVRLRRLIASGAVSFADGGKEIRKGIIGRILINSQIGWGRERYVPILERISEDYWAKKEGVEGASAEYLAGYEKNATYLAGVMKSVLKEIPETGEGGLVWFDRLCAAASSFLWRFGAVGGELDGEAKKSLISALDEAGRVGKKELPIREAIGRIGRLAGKLRVGQSGPQPGAVHVSSYVAGGLTGRPNTFVVGCEQGLFPGTTLQDPVLLDEDRAVLHKGLAVSSGRLKESLYRMASLLASVEGSVTLSFSSCDVLEGKDSFPSTIVLQAHRLATGAHDADYSALEKALGRPAGYRPSPGQEIDGADLWIGRVASDEGMRHARHSMRSCYPGLAAWDRAVDARMSAAYTEFDGVVAPGQWDPARVMSATSLEKVARCPFRFFLEDVLGAAEVDELVRKPGEWLDFMEKGSVLHDIYAEFMKKLYEKKEKPSLREHARLMEGIADEALKSKREELPAPSEAVFQQDRKSVLRAAAFFLRSEEKRCKTVEPIMFEAEFGRPDPLSIDLGDGRSVFIKGRIDRVDRAGTHEYEVWDYKSGSSRGYGRSSVLNGGRELQPGLYSIAAEMILRGSVDSRARVRCGGYLFPTEKGGGVAISRPRDDRRLKEALGLILDMCDKGLFIYTDDKKECSYCSCEAACAEADMKTKFSDAGNNEASVLRRLREHG